VPNLMIAMVKMVLVVPAGAWEKPAPQPDKITTSSQTPSS
jgi:hypothetical protein